MSRRVYLDNGATSWPKPPATYAAVDRYLRELGAPAGRGGYAEAIETERLVAQARHGVARLLGAASPQQIAFTAGGTDSLNLALYGFLRPGDHVVTSDAEHNSVLRPLRRLESRGVTTTHIPCDSSGRIDLQAYRKAFGQRTRLAALTHASNVTGTIEPIDEAGRIAHAAGAAFLVDAAQSLGHLPLDVSRSEIDFLCSSAHKGLLSPLGLGVFYVRPGLEGAVDSFRQGGTGSRSESELQPEFLPDKYEAGNLNVPAIIGLGASLSWIAEQTVAAIRQHDQQLTARLLAGLAAIPGVRTYGPENPNDRIGVVPVAIAGCDPQEGAALLESIARVQARAGLHCSPRMHRSLGTDAAGGLIRLSIGPFNTEEDIDLALGAIADIAAMHG